MSWIPDLDRVRGPIYWRIEAALAEDIHTGALAAGERLPTHRELARVLGVTVNTVTKAYAEAERNGLVVSRVGRGTFVKIFPEEMTCGGDMPRDVLDLSANISATDALEPVLNRLMGALSRRGSLHALLQRLHYPGVERHRKAGVHWIARRGIKAKADQVVVCGGGQEGLLTVLSTVARSGDTILTEKLNYAGLRYIAKTLNLNLCGIATDEYGLVPDALEAACRRTNVSAVVVTPTNHNPTNAFASMERRQAMVDITGRTGTLIVEDDAFGHLAGGDVPTLTALAPDRCIYVCGLSKSIAPGLRVGYVLAPPVLMGGLVNSLRAMYSVYPALMAEIATSLIEAGHADEFLALHRCRALERFRLAQEELGIATGIDRSSYHLWLPLPQLRKSGEFVAELRAKGVLVSPPEKFAVDHQLPPNGVRLALGMVDDPERLREGLRIIAACYNAPEAGVHHTA